MANRLTFLLGIALISASPLPAATDHHSTPVAERQEEATSLQDLFRIADERNYDLLAQQKRIEALMGRRQQAGLYPNPVLGVQTQDVPAHSMDTRDGKSSVSLSQPLVVGKRRRAAVAVEDAEIAIAKSELEKMRREIFRQVDAEYIEILYNRDELALIFDLLDDAQAYRDSLVKSDATAFDLSRVDLEIQDMKRTVLKCITQRSQAATRLWSLLGDYNVDPQHVHGELVRGLSGPQLSEGTDSLVEKHPEMDVARARVTMAQRRISLAKAERVPDLTVSGSVGYDGRVDEGMVGAGISIPLPIFDHKQGAIVEAERSVEAAERDREATFNRLKSDLTTAIFLLNETDSLTTDYKELFSPTSRHSWMLSREKEGNEKATRIEELDALRTQTRTLMSELQYIRDYNVALNRIRYFEGYGEEK